MGVYGTSLLILSLCGWSAARVEAQLARTNDAIEAWIEHIDSDRPFLLLNIGAGQMRLHHGAALLRHFPVVAARIDSHSEVHQRLQARLRRYGAVPFQSITAGPFDWEQYLVREADDECALSFDGGLLLHADSVWSSSTSAVRLTPTDLRALYDAVADSVELVLLPAGWNTSPGSEN